MEKCGAPMAPALANKASADEKGYVWVRCTVCKFSGGYEPERAKLIKTCPVLKGPFYKLRGEK